MATPAASLHIVVTANTTPAATGLTRLNSQLAGTTKQANAASGAVKQMAKAGVLGGVAVAAHKAVGSFVDFDRSMRNVNSIAKLSEKRFDSLSKQVLDLAGPTAQAPKTLADGLYQLVSSGFDANESIKILSKTAVAATAGLTDTATATQVVAAAINAYGLKAKDAGHVSDVLFKTVDRGVVTFAELAQSLGPVLPAANSLNVSLEQVGAALATLTKQGFPAAEAATAIDAAMRALLKPSQDMKTAFKELGVAGGEELVRKYGSLQGALKAVRSTTDGSGQAMNKLFNEIRGARGALTLTGANARGAAKDLRDLGDSAGSTSKAFKEQSKSAAVQWQQLKAELSAAAAEIGAKVFPIFRRLVIVAMGAQKTISEGYRALGRFLVAVWNKPKKAFGDLIALVLRGMGKLFDAASKLPIVGNKFDGLGDKARAAAEKVDRMGENTRKLRTAVLRLPDGKTIKINVQAAFDDFPKLKSLQSLGGSTGGPSSKRIMSSLETGVKERSIRWLADNADKIAPLIPGPGNRKAGGVYSFIDDAARFGLGVTSTFRPGPGFHGQNRAIDFSNSTGPTPQMMAFARYMIANFGRRLKELFYSPLGGSIDNGQWHPGMIVGGPLGTPGNHYNHVHVAMAKGGVTNRHVRALVGEQGPEIVDLPKGARVHPFSKSKQMVRSGLFPGFAGGGIVTAVDAARKAGFRSRALVEMVAIAGGESGWNPKAHNTRGEDSRGLWQINIGPGANTDLAGMNLFDPYVNARAARIVKNRQGLDAWTIYREGIHRQFMARARAAVLATRGKRGRMPKMLKVSNKLTGGRMTGGGKGGAFGRPVSGRVTGGSSYAPGTVEQTEPGEDPRLVLAEALRAHMEELAGLRAATQQQNAINGSTLGISLKEAHRALADLISGQLGVTVAHAGQSAGNPAISRRY